MKLRVLLAIQFLFLFVVTGPCVSVRSQEMVVGNDAGVGGRAMGMGGAFTAVADDYTALYYNPAGLAQMRSIELNLGIGILNTREQAYLRSVTGSPSNGSDTGTVTVNSISSFGGVIPVPTYRGSLVFAAGYNRIKEFDSDFRVKGYSDLWGGQLTGESSDEGGMDVWSLAGAFDASQNISLGGSLNFYRGEHKLEQRSAYYDQQTEYAEFISSGYIDKISAWNVNLGMVVHSSHNLRFGAVLKFPVKYNYRDSYYDRWYSRDGEPFNLWEHVSPAYADSSYENKGKFRYYVKSPMELDFGISWIIKTLTFSADVNYIDWSQTKTDLDEPEYFYKNTTNWRIGCESVLPFLNTFIRAGYASVPDPYKGYVYKGDPQKTNIIQKNKKDYVTFGVGILLDQSMMLDLAFIHGYWKSVDTPRTDESTRNKLFISLSYRI